MKCNHQIFDQFVRYWEILSLRHIILSSWRFHLIQSLQAVWPNHQWPWQLIISISIWVDLFNMITCISLTMAKGMTNMATSRSAIARLTKNMLDSFLIRNLIRKELSVGVFGGFWGCWVITSDWDQWWRRDRRGSFPRWRRRPARRAASTNRLPGSHPGKWFINL